MIQLLELSVNLATIIAIILPVVVVCLFLILNPWLKTGGESKLRRYLSYLVSPPQIGPTNSEVSPEEKWRNTKVKLFFYYLGVVILLASLAIAEFYEVMFDLLLPVSQGSTGEGRIVTTVIIQTPYVAGWFGSLPWSGLMTYHETWNWIFLTAAFTDNPAFLGTIIVVEMLISIGFGLVFLVPLATKRIRQSFLSAMFFFITGMMISSKTAINCLGYALALVFGGAELHYGNMTATGSMIQGVLNVLAFNIPIVLVMFTFFIVLGRKLWRNYYPDPSATRWFMIFVALCFWGSLGITILMV